MKLLSRPLVDRKRRRSISITDLPDSFQKITLSAMNYNTENWLDGIDIIAHLQKDDEKALATLLRHFSPALIYFAMQYLDNFQAAEDIVTESFIKIWQRRNDFESLAAIKSFLYTTVKNACINQLKQSTRHSASHAELEYLSEKSEELFAESKLIKAELFHRIWHDIEKLPPMRRRIFKMIYIEGLSSFEVARALKISVDTVRVQKARALHALRKLIR